MDFWTGFWFGFGAVWGIGLGVATLSIVSSVTVKLMQEFIKAFELK